MLSLGAIAQPFHAPLLTLSLRLHFVALPLPFLSASKRNAFFGTPSIILKVVILVGQLLTDSSTVPLIATSPIIKSLYELYQDKKDDAEIQLQLLFTFLRVLSYQDTREELLYR